MTRSYDATVDEVPDIREARRAASERLVARLAESDDPVLVYKARRLGGLPADAHEAMVLRGRIADSPMARALVRVLDQDVKTLQHTYRKWQGPHWTLVFLALIDYPPGDESLRPLVRRVHDWLLSAHSLEPPRTVVHPGQEHRVRHCASQDGNAIWSSVRLGLDDDRTREVVDRLIGWQWPDGGWNCDKRVEATASSFQESLIPARGLQVYGRRHGHEPALRSADRVAELVLPRRLLWRRRDGALISPRWGGRPDRIHYPNQFLDVLFALQVMVDLGRIDDRRCTDALAMLEAKRLADGGFPLEQVDTVTSDRVVSRGSYATWGPGGSSRSNPLVSLAALEVIRAAEETPATGGRPDA